MNDAEHWAELARQLRVDSVRTSGMAGSGHPTSSLSAADLMAVLVGGHLRYDFSAPDNPANDHLVFSKGHASPLLYAIYRAVGAVSGEELESYRTFGSPLEGHPTPVLPWVDVATGSLGQGLPIGVGLALAAKELEDAPSRVWVLCGDSEMAEGSMWEALDAGGFHHLDNLCAILDVNRLGQRGPTRWEWDTELYAARARAFGWEVVSVDGHDYAAIDDAYRHATETAGRPTMVVARTIKGKGVPPVEDENGYHGKAIPDWEEAVEALGGPSEVSVEVAAPPAFDAHPRPQGEKLALPSYEVGEEVPTRKAYGQALTAVGAANPRVVALDGEVANSTYAELFRDAHPDRYFEAYIAECQMVATAVGLQVRGWVPFASSFAAFFARAYDFVRMAAVSRADIALVGSHAGVSIGEDGPSQMGLEDLAAFRAVHSSTVLYPCCGNQTAALVAAMADTGGIRYLRTSRNPTPVLYGPEESFEVGGAKVLRHSDHDQVTLVGAGITTHEALAAADALAAEDISARVVDADSVKPIDAATLTEAARATGGRLVVVEDHWPEGGLGEAVMEVFADTDTPTHIRCLAVEGMPSSGKPAELLAAAGIDAEHIADAARKLISASGADVPTGDYKPQHVPLNMYETHGALVVVAPLPGVMADDVEVTVEDSEVRISAGMRTPAEKDYELHEWHYGPFERTVPIPDEFGGPVAATFGNGQLAVRVERGDGRKPGKVVVHPDQA